VQPLKTVTRGGCVNGAFKKSAEFGSGTRFINVSDAYSDNFEVKEGALDRVVASSEELERYSVARGDVFFVRSSLKLDGVGRSAIAGLLSEPAIFDCHLVRIRPKSDAMNPEFLIAYLNSAVRAQLVSRANLVTMATMDQGKIATLPTVVPPLPEQAAIVGDLRRIWASTSGFTSIVSSNIALLREYRSALITAAVTGQLDIREHEKKMEALA
jgi:type I restriction enzyme S subunit